MKASQVDQALSQKFVSEGERLVFWHDPNGEFADYVEGGLAGDIASVQVLDVGAVGGLSTKLLLEREDRTGQYLVYSQGEAPGAEEDWLLDIRLYSAQFHADMASLWLQELGLTRLSLRDHLKARAVFLGSQDRRKKLGRFLGAEDDEASLDLKMLAVLAGSQLSGPFDVLSSLCDDHAQADHFSLSKPPEIVATFEKMGLAERFWELMGSEFAYSSEVPTVAGLLRRLFISELFRQTDDAPMPSLAQHQLPAWGARNAVVFLTQWRDSSGKAASYDAAAAAVAKEQKVGDALKGLDLETLKDVYTFWDAEKRVVSSLKERLLAEEHTVSVEAVSALATERRAGHWLSGPGSDAAERRAAAHAYDAIEAAAELFALHRVHRKTMSYGGPAELLAAYQEHLHRFDRLYRQFCTKAKPALSQDWDLLKTLAERVEQVYGQGFLQPLGMEWSRLLDEGFLGQWALKELPAQQDFYAKRIRPHLSKAARNRAFVIISDAFRYEAAKELTEQLNGKYRLQAELTAMLGVLPSYTALGMASLLPHKTLAYNEKGDVIVDGKLVAGTEARGKQLATVEGMACQAKELRAMKQEDARALTDGARVVYIYHDVIDSMSEGAATESDTFDFVSRCIKELVELVKFCVNRLNAGKVWVTADHGFLYQQEALSETDKSKLSHKPEHAVISKKRYVIGRDLGTVPEAHHGSIDVTAGAEGGMEFWVPRGANRFHFTGGARFTHGGAMPQEVLVPVVTATNVRGERQAGTRSEKVSVQVLGTNHKITAPKYRFEFIQTEPVGERKRPITLRAAVYDGEAAVTSIQTLTFDSSSDSMDERKKSLRLELGRGPFDKATPYRLVLHDVETEAEVLDTPVVIDRSFTDDF